MKIIATVGMEPIKPKTGRDSTILVQVNALMCLVCSILYQEEKNIDSKIKMFTNMRSLKQRSEAKLCSTNIKTKITQNTGASQSSFMAVKSGKQCKIKIDYKLLR
jgi:hypothetical protein